LLSELNTKQGTTLIVVTHNPQVAGVARRVITIRDGKIQSDVDTEGTFEYDLLELKHSALGQALLQNGSIPAELEEIAPELRKLLDHL